MTAGLDGRTAPAVEEGDEDDVEDDDDAEDMEKVAEVVMAEEMDEDWCCFGCSETEREKRKPHKAVESMACFPRK